jgi:diguanylate cyclase (GGDEF)-like protein
MKRPALEPGTTDKLPSIDTYAPIPSTAAANRPTEQHAKPAAATAIGSKVAYDAVDTTQPAITAADRTRREVGRISGWALAFLAALAAGWMMWQRNRRLSTEAQRLAVQHRALRSTNVRLQNESDELRQQAINDTLTGTLNRQAFATGLREMLTHAAHYGLEVHLVIFDLDHFKSINDRFGHMAGDSALKRVAGIVHEHLDSDDLFGRFGGDEFLIACSGQEPGQTAALAESIRNAVEHAADRRTPTLPGLTVSMGIACTGGEHAESADTLFARADAALYEAKRRGRNRIVTAGIDIQTKPTVEASSRHL